MSSNEKTISQFDEHVVHSYGRMPVALKKGEGRRCVDENGVEYIDFGSGIGTNSLGYCDEKWADAVCAQVRTLQHNSNYYYTQVQADLAEKLCKVTGYKGIFFGNSGEAPKTESAKAAAAQPKQRKSIYDDMSVDDLLNALTDTKQPEPVEVPEEEEVPVIVSSVMHTEASTQSTRVFSAAEIAEMEAKAAEKAEPAAEEKPVPKKKKKIVISAELPDYEEIRRRDLEKDRLEREAADKAARETEEKARLEAERVAREAEEKARLEAERVAREAEEKARLEAERAAREAEEKARLEAENTAHEVTAEEGFDEVHGEETDDKSGIFSKIKNIFSSDKEEPEADGETDTEENPVSELAEELFGNMNNGLETADESEPPTDLTETESEIATPPILDETAEDDDSTDSVDSLLDNIRENTAAAIADLEAPAIEKEETPETPAEVPEEPAKKCKSRVTSALEGILDENPDEIISERSEKTEDDVKTPKR